MQDSVIKTNDRPTQPATSPTMLSTRSSKLILSMILAPPDTNYTELTHRYLSFETFPYPVTLDVNLKEKGPRLPFKNLLNHLLKFQVNQLCF